MTLPKLYIFLLFSCLAAMRLNAFELQSAQKEHCTLLIETMAMRTNIMKLQLALAVQKKEPIAIEQISDYIKQLEKIEQITQNLKTQLIPPVPEAKK